MAEGYAAAAVLAMPDQHLAANLAELFRTRRFRTYTTDDVVGVEMAGALKNVYAIAVGMGYSLGIGENTRAMVMAAWCARCPSSDYGLSMPIAREVDAVINHGATPEGAYRGLAAEKPGHEVHGAGF